MDWFLYDNGLRHKRVKQGDLCINQLLSVTHEIYKSFDDGLEVRGIFLDISKHLIRYGTRGSSTN